MNFPMILLLLWGGREFATLKTLSKHVFSYFSFFSLFYAKNKSWIISLGPNI